MLHNVRVLLGRSDSTVLILSKLVYHLIHCLIYRPFLPINLAELSITGQHQSWQIEATNLCFVHANAVAELVDLGEQEGSVEWPAFAGYCIATAGTVHVHGAYYDKNIAGSENIFAASTELLSLEIKHLTQLCYEWESVQHQHGILLGICKAHDELVKSSAGSGMRHSPAFYLEDFLDRYCSIAGPGGEPIQFDPASHSTMKRSLTGSSTHRFPELNFPPSFTVDSAQSDEHLVSLGQAQSFPGMPSANPMPTPEAIFGEHFGFHPGSNAMRNADRDDTYASSKTPTNSLIQPLPPSSFGPLFGTNLAPRATGPNSIMSSGTGSHEGLFERKTVHTLQSPQTWQDRNTFKTTGLATDTGSNCESPLAHCEEQDPFLSLLERIAEDEQHLSGGQLDFFFNPADCPG
jgi:hypothetical protein